MAREDFEDERTSFKMTAAGFDPSQVARDFIEKVPPEHVPAMLPVLEALSQFVGKLRPAPEPVPESPITRPDEHVGLNQQLVENLKTMEQTLEAALALPETERIEQIKACAQSLRLEREALEKRIAVGAAVAQSAVSASLQTHSPSIDPATGLRGRSLFEQLVNESIERGEGVTVALFLIKRLSYVNRRFGRAAGDEILLFMAQHLARELGEAVTLFRWTGPAFAAILGHGHGAASQDRRIKAIAIKQFPKTLETGGRSVMLSINCAYFSEQLSSQAIPAEVFARMDDFVADSIRE